jgi:23S rRNA (uracil1939-C5)-methyltransferase
MDPTIESGQVQVSSMTFGPFAIGRTGEKVVMIRGAAPGDILEIEACSDRHDYVIGTIARIVRPSPQRRKPPCRYFAACGGCDWQHIKYDAQIRLKGEIIASVFRQALGITLDPDSLVEPAPAEANYRARVRLKTGPGGVVGFRHAATNSLVPVEECAIAATSIVPARCLAASLGRTCSEIEVVEGRHGTVLVVHLTRPPRQLERKIASQFINDGTSAGLILRNGATRELFGDVALTYECEPGCVIQADADLFSQVNRAQNLKLVPAVMCMAEISPGSRVLDLFCGTGNFSLPAARRGAQVIGIDHDSLAIATARDNAERMGRLQTQFIAMRSADGLRFLFQSRYRPDVLIMDPPRAGAADLIDLIARLQARRLIYVSCNLSTLARDLQRLSAERYKLQLVRAFDFFPNTHHLEIVVSLLLT